MIVGRRGCAARRSADMPETRQDHGTSADQDPLNAGRRAAEQPVAAGVARDGQMARSSPLNWVVGPTETVWQRCPT
jgi:hypothetical protein